MFFLICGCGAYTANCLDDPLEIWKSNANEGLGVGALILIWRLLKELFQFQWKTHSLQPLGRASQEIPLYEKKHSWRKWQGRDALYIGSFSG